MATESLLRMYTAEASADLSTRQFQAVHLSGPGTGAPFVDVTLTLTTKPFGILQNTPSVNQAAEVALIGSISKWKTNSALTAGDLVGVSSGLATQLVTGTTTSGQYYMGLVIDGTAAASGVASVLLIGPGVL